MSETKMPAAEVSSYELAFHVLPTVAEGEVATVFKQLKDIIAKHGGEVTIEEEPARFDLAYEIIKYLEGRNRKFSSAYFGWVRFTAEPAAIEAISHDVEEVKELLRHILIKLTKVEDENPFMFHEALAEKQVENIEVDEVTAVVESIAVVVEDETPTTAEKDDVTSAEDGEEKTDKV